MERDSPGLFDMDIDVPAGHERAQRGRNRETWACAATATVTILDRDAVNDVFAELEETAFVVGELAEPAAEDAEGLTPLGQLAWLVWPTEGMDVALAADTFRILSVETEVLDDEGDRGKLAWTVTLKLRNVQELRRLAVEACPGDAELIANSLAVAWQRAIDPFAPIRSVPGIEWQAGTVDLTLVPARSGRNH